MRIITYPLLLIMMTIMVVFALTNKHMVHMGIWPFEQRIILPAFAWILGTLAIGIILGAILSSFGRQKQKAKLRILQKQAQQESNEAKAIRAEAQSIVAEPRGVVKEAEPVKALTSS